MEYFFPERQLARMFARFDYKRFESKLTECDITSGDAYFNYRQFTEIQYTLYWTNYRKKNKNRFTVGRRQRHPLPQKVQRIRRNMNTHAEQRALAFKHHWHDVPLFGSSDYPTASLRNGNPSVNDWAAEVCEGRWAFTVEQTMPSDKTLFYLVYWFEHANDAMLCRLSFDR